MIVLSEVEDRTIVCLFVWTKHRNVTDRQTDSPWLLQRTALRIRKRCKNFTQSMQYGLTSNGGFRRVQHVWPNRGPHKKGAQKAQIY